MIEFKGECGHTIRAKDEDAGKVVRCSYCGREAPVPDEREDQLDFLLSEVERSGEYESPRKRRATKPKPARGTAGPVRPRSDFNPFAVALKMCYLAIIITVVIVAGKYGYKQWVNFDRARPTAEGEQTDGSISSQAATTERQAARSSAGRGLLWPKLPPNQSGLFLNSVPPGATVLVRRERDASDIPILKDSKVKFRGPAGRKITVSPGCYEVAVAVKLTDPGLMRLPGYHDARRAYDHPDTPTAERVKVFENYFLPDRSKRITVETLSDYSQVIVRHYEVEVVKNSWTPETALFLPADLALSQLMDFLPQKKVFGFDVDAVRVELSFRDVPEGDQQFIIDALYRIGMIPYRLEDQEVKRSKPPGPRYRLFSVSVMDGTPSSPLLN